MSIVTAAVAPPPPPPPEVVNECSVSFVETDVDFSNITDHDSGTGDQDQTSIVRKYYNESYQATAVVTLAFHKKALHQP